MDCGPTCLRMIAKFYGETLENISTKFRWTAHGCQGGRGYGMRSGAGLSYPVWLAERNREKMDVSFCNVQNKSLLCTNFEDSNESTGN